MAEWPPIPPEFDAQLERVKGLLAGGPEDLELSESVFHLSSVAELAETQLGYSIGANGENFTGTEEGDWQVSWLVIGWGEDLGDPLFVDLSSAELPVFIAEHGQGAWEPQKVAPNLNALLAEQ